MSQPSALSHIRVCDFTGQLAGAGATRIMAIFGAQVIRIEDRVGQGTWDVLRGGPPYPDERRGIELGGAFNNHNVEKLGVTINMRLPEGRELARQLISVSDVVAENFSAGVMERWGLTYDEMRAIKPDIIYVSNSGCGHEGPYRTYKTFGPVVQALSGLTFQSALPDMPPAGWGYSYMDHGGAYAMCIAILMALYHRNATGEGQRVDMSCTDAAAAMNGPGLLDYTVNERPMRRPGQPNSNRNEFPPMAPHGIYKCAGDDRWVAISVRSDSDWAAMCDAVGHPEWLADPRFSTLGSRMELQDELDEMVEGWTCSKTPREAMDILQAAGVPAAAVQWPEERIDQDANTAAWGLWPTVTHPQMGEVRVDGIPVKMSKAPTNFEHGAPVLGQHNGLVVGEILGAGPDGVNSLEDLGAI